MTKNSIKIYNLRKSLLKFENSKDMIIEVILI